MILSEKEIYDLILEKAQNFTSMPNPSGSLYDAYNRIVDQEERRKQTLEGINAFTGNTQTNAEAKLNPTNIEYPIGSVICFRGEWKTDTKYLVGDYVYLKDRRPGFFYRCVVSGYSQSEKRGYSDFQEPLWKFETTYDGVLVWKPIDIRKIDPVKTNLSNWTSRTIYNIGQCVRQASGKPIVFNIGTPDEVEIVYQLNEVITKVDWPILPEQRVIDNTVEWETCLSIGYLLPRERLKEPTFYEFVQILDYLILHEQLFFNDYIHKYNDLTKVRSRSLKEIIAETGYGYVADLLSLEDKELATLVKYINIISDMKGSKSGLEIVFNLLDMRYNMSEWWEKNPKGTPHTWDLSIELDIQKVVANMISKLVTFTRNYVYPVIENFEIIYKMNMAELAAVMAGFIDISMITYPEKRGLLAIFGGFVDIEKYSRIEKHSYPYISYGGFVDLEYIGDYKVYTVPVIIEANGTINKSINFVNDVSILEII